ncbi:pentatricopeptide repeat-containing protein At2g33680-like isoform X2 [Humulus lupulus]|uniref:pentatricopeptide repeat-containing protein At2g33680-like isoform X2 n=1 Tax=Humulus lupulus TaxID=3486 RepID=UPI002B4010AE|nr:pentatricopeptide repeat-containing protein At2g33680-like isoform X2 [Humulus lupulus]
MSLFGNLGVSSPPMNSFVFSNPTSTNITRTVTQPLPTAQKSNRDLQARISSLMAVDKTQRQILVDILRDSANRRSVEATRAVHGFVLKSEFPESDLLVLLNHVSHAYSKCMDFATAHRVFDKMSERNIFSWTAMIVGSTENGLFYDGFKFFCEMMNHGILPDKFAYSAILQTCIGLGCVELGKMIHAQIVARGFSSLTFVSVSLLNMYAKLGSIDDSYEVFSDMREHNQVSWNAMISGFTSNNHHLEAFQFFLKMKNEGISPNMYTIISVSKAVGKLGDIDKGRTVHAYASELHLDSNVNVGTALIDMYSKCKSLSDARSIFDSNFINCGINTPWNAMISGYSQCGYSQEALELFVTMYEKGVYPDLYTYCSVFNAISAIKSTRFGREVHGMVLKSGSVFMISVSNAIVDAYAKCELLEDVRKVFDRMEERDVVSWTTLVAAYSQCSEYEEAFVTFSKMREEGFTPNQFTFSTVLDVSASLCLLDYGKQVHGLLCKAGLDADKCTESALIDMYSKCGFITEARKIFESISNPDTVTWTAIISSYAQHGLVEDALLLFRRMEQMGVKANAVTLLCILFACSHRGMVEEGLLYFQRMQESYGLVPKMEHYACIVDLLGRVGHLTDAMEFIENMPIEPNEMVWQTLLGACRVHGNVELGEIAAEKLLSVRPEYSATYVLLSNTYMEAGSYEDGISLRHMMKDRGVRKEAGCSWISVKGEIHKFYAGDQLHQQKDHVYAKLEELMMTINSMDYVPDVSNE